MQTLKLLIMGSLSCMAFAALAHALRPGDGRRLSPTMGFLLSLLSFLTATLVPVGEAEESKLRLDPMSDLDDLQALGNLLLLVPLGGFLALRGMSRLRVVLIAATLSVGVEILQYHLVSGRYASVGDVLLNTTGAVIGSAVASWRRMPVTH